MSCWLAGIFWPPSVSYTGSIEPVSPEKIADLKLIFVALSFMTHINAIVVDVVIYRGVFCLSDALTLEKIFCADAARLRTKARLVVQSRSF